MNKIGLSLLLIISLTGCGDSCYTCYQESYWNGISYTEKGEYFDMCKEDGESDEEFETRIDDYESNEDAHKNCFKK